MSVKLYCDYCNKETKMNELHELKITFREIEKIGIRKDICINCIDRMKLIGGN